jgi:hypothetical protein
VTQNINAAIFLFIAVCLWGGNSEAILTDFNALKHGEIVSSQFSNLGLTISGVNPNRSHDLAIIFDSSRTGTDDPDLEGPPDNTWAIGNLAPNQFLGNLLIIAENNLDIDEDELIDRPDDEGLRPGGLILFDFDTPITTFGFDLIDIEGASEGFQATFIMSNTGSASLGYDDFTNAASPYYDSTIMFGDNSANRISSISAEDLRLSQFDRVQMNLGGSGAIDNIHWTTVPEPGSIFLIGSGLIGLGILKQKNSQTLSAP